MWVICQGGRVRGRQGNKRPVRSARGKKRECLNGMGPRGSWGSSPRDSSIRSDSLPYQAHTVHPLPANHS